MSSVSALTDSLHFQLPLDFGSRNSERMAFSEYLVQNMTMAQ